MQARLAEALDCSPPGPIRLISMCAGQGRDVLGVVPDHARRGDVSARLVELDERNVIIARAATEQVGLAGTVEILHADGSTSTAYARAVPADIVLACGIFGNISDEDIAHTVSVLPQFCAPGATVLWTRHRAAPDLTPAIREWFETAGFDEVGFDGPEDSNFGVGVHRLRRSPEPLRPDVRLFTFLR